MTKIREQFLLDDEVTIESFPKNSCKICLNQLQTGEDKCVQCLDPPPFVGDWYFECVNALGLYHKYKQDGYSIPINILSDLILLLKFRKGKEFKNFAGSLLAKGLFKILEQMGDFYGDISYIVISPKFKRTEENQVTYILNPFMEILRKKGYDIKNISNYVKRLRDVGKNKGKGFKERFRDIKGVHEVELDDLEYKDVVILDDIFTTGSTSWDLARALKEKNAGKIFVLVAGRHWLFDEWPINELYSGGNFSFSYLINYFSRMDYIRDKNKISKVKVIDLVVQGNQIYGSIKGSRGNYDLKIDLDNKILKHSCPDFINNRKRNKKFCKHISIIFIKIRKEKNEKFSCDILNSIYRDLKSWQFNEI